MKFLLAFFLYSHSVSAIDVGNGSDGVCNISGGGSTQITGARRSYQCTTLNIDMNLNDFRGDQTAFNGSPLIIKVQGDVILPAGVTIDLSGQDGFAGSLAATAGGRGGAGGNAGGSTATTTSAGTNGSGEGGGVGGDYVPPFVGGSTSYGGGGGGGSYKTVDIDQGIDGEQIGSGSIPGSGGENGNSFGNESLFDSSFVGGSGGAAGGGGNDGVNDISGSSGGGGGGAIRIIAGGNIIINGSIISRGGNGGGTNATTSAGGGGAGSGGAIWLQAAGALTVGTTATLTTLGGVKGENDSGSIGFGGDGGDGRIRLDDGDGIVTIPAGATVNPAPYKASFTPSASLPVIRQYQSNISCARVSLEEDFKPFNQLINMLVGLSLAAMIYFVSRKSKL